MRRIDRQVETEGRARDRLRGTDQDTNLVDEKERQTNRKIATDSH